MQQEVIISLIFLIVACVLLVSQSALYRVEAFRNLNTNLPYGMCGVDLPSCEDPLRCINGYCKPQGTPAIPVTTDLPVLPEGYIRL